jgi:hypothetical protein
MIKNSIFATLTFSVFFACAAHAAPDESAYTLVRPTRGGSVEGCAVTGIDNPVKVRFDVEGNRLVASLPSSFKRASAKVGPKGARSRLVACAVSDADPTKTVLYVKNNTPGAVPAEVTLTLSAFKKSSIAGVCPSNKIEQIGTKFFYKNNKPIRAGSALAAPVIGQNNVITLAGQPGGPRIFGGSGVLYSTNGKKLANLTPYPCRGDHCSGRVVSSAGTTALRQAAQRASGSPAGYIKVGGICVFIPHLGKCFGGGVDMSRPSCNKTL